MARAAWFRVAASIVNAAFLKAVIYIGQHNPRQPTLGFWRILFSKLLPERYLDKPGLKEKKGASPKTSTAIK